MIDRFTYQVAVYRNSLFVIALVLLGLMAVFIRAPEIDSRLAGYNIDHNPYDSAGERMNSLFAHGQMVQVLVQPGKTSTGELFEGLEQATGELTKNFPGVRVESIHRLSPLLYRKLDENTPVKEMLAASLDIPLARNLVGRDTTTVLLVAFVDSEKHFDVTLFDSIIGKNYSGIDRMIAVSRFHIQEGIENSIKSDYLLLLPLILLIITGFLFITYRNVSGILFCLINICISFIPVLFFLTLFEVTINQVTASAIPVVVILSISNSVHLLTGFLYRMQEGDMNTRLYKTLMHYFVPSLLATLTTAIAFGSFYLSDSLYIREFGMVTAGSIVTVFLLTYMISPFTLRFVHMEKGKSLSMKFFNNTNSYIFRYKKIISIVLLCITAVSVFFISEISFKTNLETYIPRKTDLFKNTLEINQAFHSLAEIDLLIEPDDTITTGRKGNIRRELIDLVDEFSGEIAAYPETGNVESIVNQMDFENLFSFPGFRTVIFPRSNNPYVSKDQQKYRINIKLRNSDDIWPVKQRIEKSFEKYKPRFRYSEYSDFLFFQYISSSITNSLLRSLLVSAVMITGILFLMSMNLKITLVSIIANLVPMGFLVMVFALFGIDMNITTSITLVICLGMIVDDTIHILYRKVRLKEPLNELSFGILVTSLILFLGFLTFVLSQSRPNQIFGLLCALVFLLAAISDLTVMSWLLKTKQSETEKV